jgi:hypothetical protein
MQLRKISFIGCLITFFITTISFSQVSLEIKNVNISAGTLDIYMTNQSGCSYCSDLLFDNQTGCEVSGNNTDGAIWKFDNTKDETACTAANGIYFDGNVGGFQIIIPAITATGASGGSAESNTMQVSTSDNKASKIIGFSLTGTTIPASDGLLTTVTFSAVNTTGIICIPLQVDCGVTGNPNNCIDLAGNDSVDGSDNNPVISDSASNLVKSDVGLCWCGSSGGDQYMGCDDTCSLTPVQEDCANACGGSAVEDECGVCNGTGSADGYDCDGDVLSISQISSYIPDEFSISQNFPNPFNPVTSITFDVVQMDEISLVVYDLTGKEIATLVSGVYTPGSYIVEWNAQNNAGHDIASGMYIYRYISNEEAITRKMLYLK